MSIGNSVDWYVYRSFLTKAGIDNNRGTDSDVGTGVGDVDGEKLSNIL